MLLAILSDIHANLEGLDAVLGEIRRLKPAQVLCLGDIVGYGADPEACIQTVIDRGWAAVAGNHDVACVSPDRSQFFNGAATEAIRWTRSRLHEAHLAYLGALPFHRYFAELGVSIAHGAGYLPELFDYMEDAYDAHLCLSCLGPGETCFTGHTHTPAVFYEASCVRYCAGETVRIPEGARAVVNVGSVGQPRDGDPRAGFATYDSTTREVRIRRLPYVYTEAASKIQGAGLPEVLGERLKYGK